MIRVQGGIQNYAWGKKGSSSMVTLFTSHIVESASYAEYWLGTHPDAPTLSNNQNISSITGNLHYLFKLLSIAQPLSIQVHPNKAQAVELHSQNTSLYPDDNYKPEMCIAVSPMKLFYGFKSQEEISDVLQSTPELKNLVGELQDLPIMIQKLYENENVTKEYVNQYIERTRGSDNIYELTNSFYPGDTGVFFSMFMHYLEINPGEAILIHPTDPHAYIEGECIEAMATSNNVIRAGLTPKLKDVQCLLRIVNYENRTRPEVLRGLEVEPGVRVYTTAYPEFKVTEYLKTDIFKIQVNDHILGMVLDGTGVSGDIEIKTGDSFLFSNTVEILPTPQIRIYTCGHNYN